MQLIFYGLFLGLITSQSIMDLFLGLTLLVLLWNFIKEKKIKSDGSSILAMNFHRFSLNPSWLWMALPWFIYLIADFLFKSPKPNLVGSVIREFIWLPLFPVLMTLWQKINLNQKLIKVLLCILLLGSGFAVFVFSLGFDPFTQTSADRIANLQGLWRSGGFYSNPMALAQSYGPLLMILLPISIYSLFSKQKKSKLNLLLIGTFLITALAVLFTFTRGVWLAIVISTIIGGFIFNRRWGLITIVVTLISAAVLMVAWPRFNERLFQSFNAKKSYDSERMVIWNANWYIFKENPILGIGYGENKRRLREYYDILKVPAGQFEGHAHNQYLHFLAGTGVIGLLFYVIWCSLFLKLSFNIYQFYQRKNQTEWQLLSLGLFLAQISFHLGAITESNFSISKNRLLLVLIWSFIVYLYKQSQKAIKSS